MESYLSLLRFIVSCIVVSVSEVVNGSLLSKTTLEAESLSNFDKSIVVVISLLAYFVITWNLQLLIVNVSED